MKRWIILISICYSFSVSGQLSIPSLESAKQKITENASIKTSIEKKMNRKWSELTIVSDNWPGYNGTTFSLTRTECGQLMSFLWPDDAIYTQFIIQTPKDKDGVYKSIYAKVYYKRSSSSNEKCLLKNSWEFWEVVVGEPTESGYKEFTEQEAKDILITYLKAGKATILNDFIEISSIDFKGFTQSSENAAIHYLNFYFKGRRAVFTDDRTSILGLNDVERVKFRLKVEKNDNAWVGSNMTIESVYGKYEFNNTGIINYGEKTDEFYASYKTDGWDAIYPSATAKEKQSGEIETLKETINNYFEVLKNKGAELTQDDIKNFIPPSKEDLFTNWFNSFNNQTTRLALVEYNVKDVTPIKLQNEDGSFQKIAFPEVQGKFVRKDKKGKKWKDSTYRCSNCQLYSTSSTTTTNHSMVWLWENNNWYLYNPESIFSESKETFSNE